jgi:dihydroorotate dehydrogenase (fumarate)
LPLRWIAILSGQVHLDLAATGGIHEGYDVVKMLMVGACVTQLCSVLMRRGIGYMQLLEAELGRLLQQHNYESVGQVRGILNQKNYSDPSAFERAHYIRSLQSYDNPSSPAAHRPR